MHAGIGDHLLQRLAHRLGARAGEDAAVHVRVRTLWQRVGGVTGVEQGRHAVGVQDGVDVRIALEQCARGFVARVLQQFGQCLLLFGRAGRNQAREIVARRLVEGDRKLVRLDFHQRIRQVIDRVVRERARAVAAAIGDLERVVLREFLADLDALEHRLAVFVQQAATPFIQCKGRIDQCALVGGQVLGAVERAAGLFAAGQRQL